MTKARTNEKERKRKFNLELLVKGRQTWEYSGENKYKFEFFGPHPGKSNLSV